MKKLNLKKIIIMGLITTSILAVVPVGASATWREDSKGIYYDITDVSSLDPSQDSGNRYKGWLNDYPLWFYFDSEGYMKKGWLQYGDKWYYLEQNGRMATRKSVNTDGYLSDFNTDGSWINYTGGIKTVATSSNSSVDPYIDSHPDWVSSTNPIKVVVNTLFTYQDAKTLLYTKYPPFANYTESSRCDSFVPDYVQGLSLQDAKGKYQLFPTTKNGKYVGIVKMYQDGSWKEFEPGEYDGTSAQAEENKYIHGVA
jgi:FOG: Glucan-binding domain (YG repeat)